MTEPGKLPAARGRGDHPVTGDKPGQQEAQTGVQNTGKRGVPTRAVSLIKLALGVGLLAGLLLWGDTGRKLLELFVRFEVEYIAVLTLVALLMRWISAVKWSVLLKNRGIRLPIHRLLSLHLIGQFFNNFLPSMIGGDLTKIYFLGRQIRSQSQSAASVAIDRFTGLVALVFLVVAFSVLHPELFAEPLIGMAVALGSLACAALVMLLFYGRTLSAWIRRLEGVPLTARIIRPIMVFYDELLLYRTSYRTLAVALLYSIAFYFLASLSVFFSCYAIGLRPSFLSVALITPIIFLASSIPVSPGNIGWWEWCVSLLLRGAGAGMAEGLMVALIMRAISTGLSLIGGVLFLVEKVDMPRERRE